MKKGYHSTQKKYFRTIPRSEFYGVALGYAVGMILAGLLRDNGQKYQLICLGIGLAIGYFIDVKYFAEKDVPEQEAETEYYPEQDETDPFYDGIEQNIIEENASETDKEDEKTL